jgi:hypothetical protein
VWRSTSTRAWAEADYDDDYEKRRANCGDRSRFSCCDDVQIISKNKEKIDFFFISFHIMKFRYVRQTIGHWLCHVCSLFGA